MLRDRQRPPRRSQPKPDAKALMRRVPKGWKRGMRTMQGLALTMVMMVTLARLVSVAIANPAPVAVPGDFVQLGHRWQMYAPQNRIEARLLADPWARPGSGCVLDIAWMAHHAGRLTVLAVRRDGVMLSWSGGATAAGPEACPVGADAVLIQAKEYRGLLMKLARRR